MLELSMGTFLLLEKRGSWGGAGCSLSLEKTGG
jgi:hypothetical protein